MAKSLLKSADFSEIKNEVEISIQKTKPILKENNEETISDNIDKKILQFFNDNLFGFGQ